SSSEMAEVEDVVQDWMVPVTQGQIKDGTYDITVDSSSSMFRIDACVLTVADGKMTAVMTMGGTGYRYLYMGPGEEAVAANDSDYILPEENADGAHQFTVPVEALDQGIACATFSDKKEKWYDRTLVFRADGIPVEAFAEGVLSTPESLGLADGTYESAVTLYGGSGKASVDSPAEITVADGKATAVIIWSSSNYDYMIVDGTRYEPVNTEGNSTYEIPVLYFGRPMPVVADTTAMSEPHEIAYSLLFEEP
ncbi:MAG: hypothetical protein IJH77_00260, partial [Mogibacterium sp.]|nr:hypothetical protein [Mogibacterium sp.]